MFKGLLPVGSVVLLKNSTKRVMIIGFCQKEIGGDDDDRIWDYAGVLYPEGYIGPKQVFLFDGKQIDKISALGYQDAEQFSFKVQVDAALDELRKNEQEEPAGRHDE